MSDPFEQIGVKLRSAREAAGLELAEAAGRARVPKAAAEALEAENFSYFDSQVYAKSFLLQYSESLGVDARTWLDALEPGSFMASGALVQRTEPSRPVEPEPTVQRGGVVSVFILLLVSAAVVVAAIKGCEFFEKKLDDKPGAIRPAASGAVDAPAVAPAAP